MYGRFCGALRAISNVVNDRTLPDGDFYVYDRKEDWLKMDFIVRLFRVLQPLQLVSILSISFFIQLKCKRKFAESIAVSVMIVIMVLYVCTLFMPLSYAGGAVLAVSFGAFSYDVFYVLRNRRQMTIRTFASFPFLLFLLYCCFVNCAFRSYYASVWDEFSHWMLVLKNMFYFDDFGVTGASTVLMHGYPPAAGLFERFFNLFSASFVEGNHYKGLNILLAALLISPLKEYKTDYRKMFMAFLVMLSVPLIFYQDAYRSLYVDCLLGVMFGRLLYLVFSEEKYDAFFLCNFGLSAAVLALTKASGKGLCLFAYLALFVDCLFFRREQAVNGLKFQNKLGGGG